jgi:hypothetical protein
MSEKYQVSKIQSLLNMVMLLRIALASQTYLAEVMTLKSV